MNEMIRDALSIAGSLGFDLADIRIIFPTLKDISEGKEHSAVSDAGILL
jgi:hypothetical protein